MGRLAAVLILAAISGCQPGASPTPSPLPTPTQHAPVAQTVLQQTDVPAGILPCATSGEFTAYVRQIAAADAPLGTRLASEWSALEAGGAQDAAISIFAMDPSSCHSELGAFGTARSAASFVVAFGDEGEADRAWQQGVLGFAPPAPGEAPPGITRGTATGLGAESWVYDRGPVRLACWRKSVFVAIVVLANLEPGSFKSATVAVDARLN